MGIIEQAIAIAKEEGIEQGIQQGIEKGVKQGIERGLEQGIEQNKVEVILKAHKAGLATELISTLVDLPVERIQSILAEHSGR